MNIYDEIIPAKSLGGVRLKDNIKNYFSIINEYNLNGKLKFFKLIFIHVDIYLLIYQLKLT